MFASFSYHFVFSFFISYFYSEDIAIAIAIVHGWFSPAHKVRLRDGSTDWLIDLQRINRCGAIEMINESS
jgi:hypothetical protein